MGEHKTPLSRVEAILQNILGESNELDTPITRMEAILQAILYDTEYSARPESRVEELLLAIKNSGEYDGELITRTEKILYAILTGGEYTEKAKSRIEELLLEWLEQGGGEEEVSITGTTPLTLEKAVAKAISSLIRYGKTIQNGTPSLSNPTSFTFNNGTTTAVDADLPSGYRRVLGFSCDNNAFWRIDGFKLKGSDVVRISFSLNAACNVFGCYQGTDAKDNYDLYVSSSSGAKYLRYGDGTYLSYWASDNFGKRFDVIFAPTGTTGMPEDSKWKEISFTSENDLLIGATTLTGTSAKLKGCLYGSIIVDKRLELIPCERLSDHTLGYYDVLSKHFYGPYEGYDKATSLGYDGSSINVDIIGTSESLTLSSTGHSDQTANVPYTLMEVDEYKDTFDVISGQYTKNRELIELHGDDSETFYGASSAYGPAIYIKNASSLWGADKNATPMCSHFLGLPKVSSGAQDAGSCFFNSTGHFYFRIANMTVSSFKTWLAEQRANGTPVMILIALSNPSKEDTIAQPLSTNEGGNIISDVSSLNTVDLTVNYIKKK